MRRLALVIGLVAVGSSCAWFTKRKVSVYFNGTADAGVELYSGRVADLGFASFVALNETNCS